MDIVRERTCRLPEAHFQDRIQDHDNPLILIQLNHSNEQRADFGWMHRTAHSSEQARSPIQRGMKPYGPALRMTN